MSGYPPEGANQEPGRQTPGGYPPGAGGQPGGGYPPGGGYQSGGGYPEGGGYQPGGSQPGGGYPPGGYPPGGYPEGQRPKVRPGRIWYLLPLALLIAGIVWFAVGITSVIHSVNSLQRVPAPGTGTVHLSHSGGYTVYYEGPGAQSNSIPGLHVNVAPVSSGARVSGLSQYGTSLTYNIGSHSGRAVLTLHVTKPGRFKVTVTGQRVSGADLAIGGSITSGIVGTVAPSIPLFILGLIGLIVLFIIRFIRKRSMRNAYPAYS